jgi:replicative superfamily II helicase
MPFVWQNHREAMEKEFYQTGKSEQLFRRGDRAKVIVATPTLAQGLNFPALLTVLVGDKRAGETFA